MVVSLLMSRLMVSSKDRSGAKGRQSRHYNWVVDEEPFDEAAYLQAHPDVARAVAAGIFPSGRAHYASHGRAEGRRLRFVPVELTYGLDDFTGLLQAISRRLEDYRRRGFNRQISPD